MVTALRSVWMLSISELAEDDVCLCFVCFLLSFSKLLSVNKVLLLYVLLHLTRFPQLKLSHRRVFMQNVLFKKRRLSFCSN